MYSDNMGVLCGVEASCSPWGHPSAAVLRKSLSQWAQCPAPSPFQECTLTALTLTYVWVHDLLGQNSA